MFVNSPEIRGILTRYVSQMCGIACRKGTAWNSY